MHCTHSSTRSRTSEKVKGELTKDNKQVIYTTQPWTVNSKHLKTINSLEWNYKLKPQWSIYSATSRKNIKNLILPNVIESTEQRHSSCLRGEHKCGHYGMQADILQPRSYALFRTHLLHPCTHRYTLVLQNSHPFPTRKLIREYSWL